MVMTGTMNNPGTVILEVADLSQILVKARVDESDVGKVETGQRAKVHIHAWPDDVFEGVVDTIALTQSIERDGTKYFETEIILADSEKKIYSGLTADVDIEIKEHKNILKIPSQAVLACEVDELPLEIRENCAEVDKEKTYAAVIYKCVEGEAIVTPVKIGESDASHTIILAGITQEDEIVVGPYKELEKIKHKKKIKIEQEEKEEKEGKEGQEEG
jgi:HlyD family secretion protein